jgi:hypothetical protein
VAPRRTLELVAFAVAPALLLLLFTATPSSTTYAWDFHAFWGAAANIDHGRSPYADLGAAGNGAPYPDYLYPPLLAEALAPLGLLPFLVAAGLFVAGSALALVAALRLLGVRDWRCYGTVFLWLPVLHGLRLGTLTPLLVLAVAAAFRLRDRAAGVALPALAATLKLFLWPVAALTAVRRPLATAAAIAGLLVGGWAAVGFAGLASYPSVLGATQRVWERDGYGLAAAAARAGLSPAAVDAALLALGAVGVALLRRLEPAAATAGAVVVACLVSPVSWLHYSMLLLVPVALLRPRLHAAWLIPLLFWVTPTEEADGDLRRVGLWLAVLTATPLAAAGTDTLGACIARIRRASTRASWRSSGRSSSPSSSTSG